MRKFGACRLLASVLGNDRIVSKVLCNFLCKKFFRIRDEIDATGSGTFFLDEQFTSKEGKRAEL